MSYRKYLMPSDISPSAAYGAIAVDSDTDTISRQAVLDALNNIEIPRNASWYQYYQHALTAVDKLPPARPERIKSKWELHTYMPHNKFCLACRNDSPYNKRWDFCPNCGADMREVTE